MSNLETALAEIKRGAEEILVEDCFLLTQNQ
jgi:hypothetical protein